MTAAHVLLGYLEDTEREDVTLQIFDAVIDDMLGRIVHLPDHLDVATFAVDDALLARLGKPVVPLANWPPRAPQEGRGIMLAGYPAVERLVEGNRVNFGLFTALVVARRVRTCRSPGSSSAVQCSTMRGFRSRHQTTAWVELSGGPLITWLETEQHLATFALGGIISEQPDYGNNEFAVERVVAARADFIAPNGRIHR